MSATLAASPPRRSLSATSALNAAAAFWLGVLVIGEIIFATSTVMFYALTALRGDLHSWNKHLAHGYIAGDLAGNAMLIGHISGAVLVTLSGAAQFLPVIRRRAPKLHRWNGRVFITTAILLSLAGLYLLIARGTPTTPIQTTGTAIMGGLVILCATMAWRTALRRNFAAHRRWALRLFLLTSAALFIRAAISLVSIILAGAGALDISVLQGPVETSLIFGQYVVPLSILELYFWSQNRGRESARFAMAAALVVLTLVMGTGIAAASAAIFVPNIRAALDHRPSIALALSDTIKSQGIEAAIRRYHTLRAMRPVTMNFDEDELNALGYELLHAKQTRAAIQILQLNTESYPASGNTWDSLGEAYMDDGDKPDSIENYNKSLKINPANRNAMAMLAKLTAK
jgi:hypothetical protein